MSENENLTERIEALEDHAARLAQANTVLAKAYVGLQRRSWIAWLGLAVGLAGLGLAGGASYIAYEATRELHQVQYQLRHDLGDPDRTRIATECHWVGQQRVCDRFTAWQVIERLDGNDNALDVRLGGFDSWDAMWAGSETRQREVDAVLDEWRLKNDQDGDGVWNYGEKPDLCPDEPSPYGEYSLTGCPDDDEDGVPEVDPALSPDHFDLCPGTPKGAEIDDRGCGPDQVATLDETVMIESGNGTYESADGGQTVYGCLIVDGVWSGCKKGPMTSTE